MPALERFFQIKASSCFEAVEALAHQNQISNDAKHKLMYAVALACELRLRWYMMKRCQDDIMENPILSTGGKNVLVRIWGKSNTANYFGIANSLQSDVAKRFGMKDLFFYFNPQFINVIISYFLNDFISVASLLSKLDTPMFSESLLNFDESQAWLGAHWKAAKSSSSNRGSVLFPAGKCNDNDYEKLNDILDSLNSFDNVLQFLNLTTETEHETKDFDKTIGFLQSVGRDNADELQPVEKSRNLAAIYRRMAECCKDVSKDEEALALLQAALEIEKTFEEKFAPNPNIVGTLIRIKTCLLTMDRFEEAQSYTELIAEHVVHIFEETMTEKALVEMSHHLGKLMLDVNKENVKFYESKMLQIVAYFYNETFFEKFSGKIAPDLIQTISKSVYIQLHVDFLKEFLHFDLEEWSDENVIAKISETKSGKEDSSEKILVVTYNAKALAQNGQMHLKAKTKADVTACYRKISKSELIREASSGRTSNKLPVISLDKAIEKSNYSEVKGNFCHFRFGTTT